MKNAGASASPVPSERFSPEGTTGAA
jgi:hypothetical protein